MNKHVGILKTEKYMQTRPGWYHNNTVKMNPFAVRNPHKELLLTRKC